MRRKIFIILFVICSLIPLGGFLVPGSRSGEEKSSQSLAQAPVLKNEDGYNMHILKEAGDWFADHFAFRSQMVTADAALCAALGVSASDGVITGSDGWLYYKDSLDDYQKTNRMEERSLFNIAHTMRMVQDTLAQEGRNFVFTVAPNKNSIYPEHMPYYYPQGDGEGNLSRLEKELNEEDVIYIDAEGILTEAKEKLADIGTGIAQLPLYHKTDSHWNNFAASLIVRKIAEKCGKEVRYDADKWTIRKDFKGDLSTMLFPEMNRTEEEFYYSEPDQFSYVGDVQSTFDAKILTEDPEQSGNLVMYRDSFGNALVPLLSNHFNTAYYSRGVPNQMEIDLENNDADLVVVERAERFLPDMAQNPPVLPASIAIDDREAIADDEQVSDFDAAQIGSNWKITGLVDEALVSGKERIYVRAGGQFLYEAYPTTFVKEKKEKPNGFTVYIPQDYLAEGMEIEVLIGDGGSEWLHAGTTIL